MEEVEWGALEACGYSAYSAFSRALKDMGIYKHFAVLGSLASLHESRGNTARF